MLSTRYTHTPYATWNIYPTALQKNCFMRRDEGHSQMDFCKSREQKVMWFFLADSKVCARMKYEGCGGNGNRYCTKKLCYEACNTTDTDTTKHGHYNRLLKQRIHG